MAHEFRSQRRVEFSDTDCAGIAHFSVFFRYMEEAEHAFLRSLGLSVRAPQADGSVIGFPRLGARCEYTRAVTFEDLLDIHLWVSAKGEKTLEYSVVFSHQGREAARGRLTVIACRVAEGRSIESVRLPEAFNRALEAAPLPPLEFHPRKQEGRA